MGTGFSAEGITRRGFLSGSGLALTSSMLSAPAQAPAQNQAAAKSNEVESMASLIWDLVAANRILADQDVLDGYGHVSVRNERNPARYLLARSMAPEITTADDIMEYDLDSNPIDGRGRAMHSERFIHGEVYKVRPEVKSVVHFHAPSVVLMSVSGETLRPI
jgi:ribulose-5-phosphate 4-epimerase/fuculose-1-phosphate aldolase